MTSAKAEGEAYACDACGATFGTQQGLFVHKGRVHSESGQRKVAARRKPEAKSVGRLRRVGREAPARKEAEAEAAAKAGSRNVSGTDTIALNDVPIEVLLRMAMDRVAHANRRQLAGIILLIDDVAVGGERTAGGAD